MPPTGRVDYRMIVGSGLGKGLYDGSQTCSPGFPTPHLDGAAFVVFISSSQERVPINQPCERPDSHCSHIDSGASRRLYPAVAFYQPPDLLLSRAAIVSFGDRKRQTISFPDLTKTHFQPTGISRLIYACSFNIGVRLIAVAPMARLRITAKAMIEISIARKIVVHTNDVGLSWLAYHLQQRPLFNTCVGKRPKPGMIAGDPTA